MSNRIQSLALVVLGVPVLLLALPAANADTIYVCWDGSGDYLAIQEGIDAGQDGDDVVVCQGTYHENIDFRGKAITVMSSGGPNVTVIDGDAFFHVVRFANGEGPGSVLDGFTIRDGLGWIDPFGRCAGGGIYCEQTSPTIKNNVIEGNQTIWFPHAIGIGGGICCLWGARPTIMNCAIHANEADYGAGIYCEMNSTPSLINCTFSANWAVEDGGGMYVIEPIWRRSPDSSPLTNCTFTGNGSSLGMGGAIYMSQAVLNLTNCILWEDWASQGPEIALRGSDVWPSWVTVYYCDVQDGQAGIYVDPYSILSWGEGNLDADPLFVDPDGNDYHLGTDSPCIDAGDPNFVPGPDEQDIDGQMRVWDGDGDGQWIVDMGSDEFGSIIPGDLDGDGCVSQGDLGILLSCWGSSGGDLNGDGNTDQADLGILLAHWGEGCP